MARNLLLSGGVAHPFEVTTPQVEALLGEVGFTSQVTEDVEAALRRLADDPVDLVTLNMLRWRMDVPRYAHLRERFALSLSVAARSALLEHLRRGGGILALHGASICFDDWPRWREVLGATWNWERSSHPPVGPMSVRVVGDHPVVAGLEDFEIIDEAYGFLDEEPGLEPLVTSEHGGRAHPLVWARTPAIGGRVVYDALGHDERSFEHPVHRTIVRRAARWAAAAVDRRDPAPA